MPIYDLQLVYPHIFLETTPGESSPHLSIVVSWVGLQAGSCWRSRPNLHLLRTVLHTTVPLNYRNMALLVIHWFLGHLLNSYWSVDLHFDGWQLIVDGDIPGSVCFFLIVKSAFSRVSDPDPLQWRMLRFSDAQVGRTRKSLAVVGPRLWQQGWKWGALWGIRLM